MEDDTTDVSCDEKDLVEQVLEYLRTNSYVDDCTEATKRTIRRKAKKFALLDGVLFYKQKKKGEVS